MNLQKESFDLDNLCVLKLMDLISAYISNYTILQIQNVPNKLSEEMKQCDRFISISVKQ